MGLQLMLMNPLCLCVYPYALWLFFDDRIWLHLVVHYLEFVSLRLIQGGRGLLQLKIYYDYLSWLFSW